MLTLKDISYRYNLKDSLFNLEITETCFKSSLITCVLGLNGSGKTTLLNVIGGHIKPESGSIVLNDIDITESSASNRPISSVFQEIGLFPHLSVLENIIMAIEPNRIFTKSEQAVNTATGILKTLDLLEYKDYKPHQISIGQQQRVAIARSLGAKPCILLLDEPTSALDYKFLRELEITLKNLRDNYIVNSIIVVSHDLDFVLDIADDIKFIDHGRLVFEGAKDAFINSEWYVK
jgi:ABC-type sulfate/molybdate transport systems ATPase subunit